MVRNRESHPASKFSLASKMHRRALRAGIVFGSLAQGAVSGFEYVVVVRFCTFPLSVSVVTVVVVWLGDIEGLGCVTVRSWTVPLSYCVVVVGALPLDGGGTG